MKKKKGYLLLRAAGLIVKVLPRKLKIKAILNLLYIFLNSLIELIGIAFLIPLLVVILDEEKIKTNFWLNELYTIGDFESNSSFIIFLSVLILFFTISKNLASLFLLRLRFRFSFSVYQYISQALFQTYYGLNFQRLKAQNSNKLVNNITSVTLLFSQNVINSVLGIINESLVFFLFAIGLFIYNPSVIFLLTLTILPFVLIFFQLVKRQMQILGKERNRVAIEQNKLLYESFQGYVDIEIRNKRQWRLKIFADLLREMNQLQVRNSLYLQLPLKFIEVVIVFALVAIICFGLWSGESLGSIGVLLGIIAVAAYRLLPGINRLMNFSLTLRNHEYTLDIIKEISTKREENQFDTSQLNSSSDITFNHRIKIERLSFSFDEKAYVLQNINFTIQKGEIIGIIGASGAGKTTLLNILLRFYKETEGMIQVDDQVLDDTNTASWRRLIGYVPQDVFVFDGTLKENIALGEKLEDVDLDQLNRVIESANLGELVSTWEKGVETPLGERGGKLSGGQKQRLGIARALYKGAEILFFDEATSALDVQTEEEINTSIKNLSETNHLLTIVIIAHRYTSLKHCTKIIELQEGKLTKEWLYDELIEKNIN
ncbi:MAG TPA: ABC transporter ATP-binding protein [Niabella sp.]|nr:ABC transporter ATP-binding protein [Niabella sp.]